MKSHAILIVVALFFELFLAQAASASEELAISPETVGPPVEIGPLPSECECPCEEIGNPKTLMQWSYADGADFDDVYRPMETDRPYFTKSASVVGLGERQLETGYTYSKNERQVYQTFPEAVLRVGALAEWFEFRVGWTWLNHDRKGNARDQSGASDPYVGIKIALTPQDEMLPETALLIDTNLPFDSLNRNEMNPGSDLVYRWTLSDKLSMGGATEFRRISLNRHDSAIEFAQSWIFERALTELLTGYAEWVMLSLDTPPEADTSQIIDGGLLYLVTDNIQLDASVGYGLNELALD
jgi:hypothetical protein